MHIDLPPSDVLACDPALIRALVGLGEEAWCALLDAMPPDAKRGLRGTLADLMAVEVRD